MSTPGSPEWQVMGITILVVGMVVLFHFEVIAMLNRWTRQRRPRHHHRRHHDRPGLLVVVSVLLAAHITEIWLFGLAFWWIIHLDQLGDIVGYDTLTLWDCIYFSATNYTTVGWGDLNAVGAIRLLAGTEALVGFMLITWSASFTYLIMDRIWSQRPED